MADEMGAVAIEKRRVGKIEPHREMTAAVFIGDELALKAREKAFGGSAILSEGKFFGLAFGEVGGAGDFDFRHEASLWRR